MKTTIHELEHIIRTPPTGGFVLVLNTGALIGPEEEAMLQALHSRSIEGILSHLRVLADKGAEKFMSTYYVGFGHKSIGDCGTATVFVEGVSMLVAKAIQDWRLYAGQESSTRYIDFATQRFVNPLGTMEGTRILEAWRTFYVASMPHVQDALRERFPRGTDEKESVYEKAIAARAFDTLRGYLPAGASTNLAWHMNLRQFADELDLLRHHPLEEVRDTAHLVEDALLRAFPSSFSAKRYETKEVYNAEVMRSYYFDATVETFACTRDTVDRDLLNVHRTLLETRPQKTELPRYVAECGTVQFEFLLDFASFRDLQRHRGIVQRMPLLTLRHGFHSWYLDELPQNVRNHAERLIAAQIEAIEALKTTPEIKQYYTAMGFMTPNRITGDLHALTYLVELRTTRYVHPTLRERAQQINEVLQRTFGSEGLVFHLDQEPDRFDIARGTHDITMHPS